MAQRKQLTWTELRVGLFVLVGLLVLAVRNFLCYRSGNSGAEIPFANVPAGSCWIDEWSAGAAGRRGDRQRGVHRVRAQDPDRSRKKPQH